MLKKYCKKNKIRIKLRPYYDREDLISRISELAKCEPGEEPAVTEGKERVMEIEELDRKFMISMWQLGRGENSAVRDFRRIIKTYPDYNPRSRSHHLQKRYHAGKELRKMMERAYTEDRKSVV